MNEDLAGIEKKIEETVRRWGMFSPGCAVVVGLSGGADSIMLTHFLLHRAEQYGIRLTAAHVNHGLRGAEADSDERFVTSFCAEHSLPLKVLRADVRSLAAEKSQGIEECGREVRYSFFRSLCGEGGRIATAHTLSDSAETVLMNLTKGAGTKGLCGIPPVRGNIVRPLIEITRAEVERYCASYGLNYITDSTNLSDDCARNKLRLHAVPILKEINPAFEASILRTTQLLRYDEEYFQTLAETGLREAEFPEGGYDLDRLRAMPRAVLLRAIPLALGRVSPSRLEYGHITAVENLVRSGTGAVTVTGGIQCAATGNTLFIRRNRVENFAGWSVPFSPEGTLLPDGRVLELLSVPPDTMKNPKKINKFVFNNLINYDTIINIDGLVRNRRPGDAYYPVGRGVKKTLKKLFSEAKISVADRYRKAVLECGGKILWVEGFGVSQEACATENSEKIGKIIIKECR